MARDPYSEIRHGDKLAGLPAEPWNKMLAGLKDRAGPPGGLGVREGAIEVGVQNATGDPLQRFYVVRLGGPTLTYQNDANEFFVRDLLDGLTPVFGHPFGIVLDPLTTGQIGRARIRGLCRVQLNLTSTAHTFASPGINPARLESDSSGPAEVLWVESDAEAVRRAGVQWAVVDLLGKRPETAFVYTTLGPTIPGLMPVLRQHDIGNPDDWGSAEGGWLQHATGLPLQPNWMYFARRSSVDFNGVPLWTTTDCCQEPAGDSCPSAPDGLCLTLASTGGVLNGVQIFLPPDPFGEENVYQATATQAEIAALSACFGTAMSGGLVVHAACTVATPPSDLPGWTVVLSWDGADGTYTLTGSDPGGGFPVSLTPSQNTSAWPAGLLGLQCPADVGTTLTGTLAQFTGSGTCAAINGTGGSGDPVATPACPDDPIPADLTATFGNIAGAAGIDGGTVPLAYFGHTSDQDVWVGNAFIDGQFVYVYLIATADGGITTLISTLAGGGFVVDSSTQTFDCSPFSATYTANLSADDPHYPGATISVSIG